MAKIPAGAKTGTEIGAVAISPRLLGASRLAAEAALWTRWRPRSLRITVIGGGAHTTFGTVVVAWTADPTWTKGNSAVARMICLKPSVVMRLNETRTFTIPCGALHKWYLTSGEAEESVHGTIVAGVVTDAGGYTGSVGVMAQLHWTVELEGPDVSLSSPATQVVTPDAGWSNIFTTSDAAWNSEVLTFKMHSGGDMVPFSAAAPNLVYTPAPGTSVPYYDSSSAERRASYFVRVSGYSIPGFVMFTTSADAQEYIRTGDPSKCIKYTKAGNLCSPSVPQFTPMAKVGSSLHPTSSVSDDRLLTQVGALTDLLTRVLTTLPKLPGSSFTNPSYVVVEDPLPPGSPFSVLSDCSGSLEGPSQGP